MVDWESILLEAAKSAEKAVTKVSNSRERSRTVGIGASGDTTLVADRDAEAAILDVLSQAGESKILSEERGVVGAKDAKWNVLVDPLDGSSNFERGIPFYCTSIAVLEGNRIRDAKYAVVRNLVNGDVYFAGRDTGATKNRKEIRTSHTSSLGSSLLTVDMCRARSGIVKRLAPLIASAKRQIHLGANALELCFIAEGRVDGFVDVRGRMRVTDFGGGYLIVRGAGGIVTREDGDELDPRLNLTDRFSYIAAANRALHRQLLRSLA
jgi:myo-inositol-1(or 4)-monophosphatase